MTLFRRKTTLYYSHRSYMLRHLFDRRSISSDSCRVKKKLPAESNGFGILPRRFLYNLRPVPGITCESLPRRAVKSAVRTG
jgi:hypothetical protein